MQQQVSAIMLSTTDFMAGNSAICPCTLQGTKSFFSEIISSVSDMKWSSDGRYILARDYMNLKLWDLNMESAPVVTYSVHEHLRAKVCAAI